MRKRTMSNGLIIGAVSVSAIGLCVAVASAATNPGDPSTSASASAGPIVSASVSARPTASGSASASPSASSSSDGSTCADVYLVTSPAGDKVGSLCTKLSASGTTISGMTVTFTPSSTCSGSVLLRISGLDGDGAEFGEVKEVSCSSGSATNTFTTVTSVTADTKVCGTLLADKYTAAEACVTVS
jgi:hypothetical protein